MSEAREEAVGESESPSAAREELSVEELEEAAGGLGATRGDPPYTNYVCGTPFG